VREPDVSARPCWLWSSHLYSPLSPVSTSNTVSAAVPSSASIRYLEPLWISRPSRYLHASHHALHPYSPTSSVLLPTVGRSRFNTRLWNYFPFLCVNFLIITLVSHLSQHDTSQRTAIQHVAVHTLSVDMTVNVWTSQMSTVCQAICFFLWLLIMGSGKSTKFGMRLP